MLHYRIDVKLSSASASTLQGTDCCLYTCLKFNCFFCLSFYVTGNRLLLVLCVWNSTVSSASASTLHYVFEIQLFLLPQLLRYREQTVACITCLKFNSFFCLSFYVTGNRLLLLLRVWNSTVSSAWASTLQGTDCCLYYVLEIQLFLRPQLLRYSEWTVACITRSKYNCFLGLRSYVTGNRLLLLLCVRNSTVSSASLHIAPSAERGTRCTEIRSGCTLYFRDVKPAIGKCTLNTKTQQFFEMSVAVYHFEANNIPEDFLFLNVVFWAWYFHDSH